MPTKAPFNGKLYTLPDIKRHTLTLFKNLSQQPEQPNSEQFITLPELEKCIAQFFDYCEKLENQPGVAQVKAGDFSGITELGDYGLQLISDLDQWCDMRKLEDCHDLALITLSLAIWIHDHNGQLNQIEYIVNALSRISNQTNNARVLTQLHEFAEKITNSVAENIKMDVDKSEPGRPWRILNLNHGIIATRSYNTEIMKRVFEQLIKRLPDDAANFFADGMKQMEIIDYPEHVKHVVQQYYQLTNNPTLH